MERLGYSDHPNWCKVTKLDDDSLLREDNVILHSPKEVLEICDECPNVTKCVERIKLIKAELYAKINEKPSK